MKSLHNSLEHYSQQIDNNFKLSIVVVDDGSTDGSSEWISKYYPQVHILKGDGNLWWTGSINKGVKYATDILKTDYAILWNDDTVCDSNYFIELDKIYKECKDHQNSILASKVFWINEASTLFNFGCYYSFTTGKKKVIGLNEKDSEQFNKITPIDWSGGMGTVIPSSILKELNYFDSNNFPQYHADIDFFLRASKRGYRAYVIPTLKIYNNRDSTGISKTQNLKDLKNLFFSVRSNYNIRHNFIFNYRHANTIISWILFSSRYTRLILQSLRTIVWS
jgi:GT2 family glycosyltransferase